MTTIQSFGGKENKTKKKTIWCVLIWVWNSCSNHHEAATGADAAISPWTPVQPFSQHALLCSNLTHVHVECETHSHSHEEHISSLSLPSDAKNKKWQGRFDIHLGVHEHFSPQPGNPTALPHQSSYGSCHGHLEKQTRKTTHTLLTL